MHIIKIILWLIMLVFFFGASFPFGMMLKEVIQPNPQKETEAETLIKIKRLIWSDNVVIASGLAILILIVLKGFNFIK